MMTSPPWQPTGLRESRNGAELKGKQGLSMVILLVSSIACSFAYLIGLPLVRIVASRKGVASLMKARPAMIE